MKIYTKAGDDGTTSLLGSGTEFKVYKHNPQVQAYGSIDEANAFLGLARAALPIKEKWQPEIRELLTVIMNDLFEIGAELSTSNPDTLAKRMVFHVNEKRIEWLEKTIDQIDDRLPLLKTFILPTGAVSSGYLHVARTIVRRAEREVVGLKIEWKDYGFELRDEIVMYLNRLSDLLFVVARFVNQRANGPEIPWVPEKPGSSE